MSEEQKLELLKSKFRQIIEASVKQDPKAETLFLLFFNAVKDNEVLFKGLAEDDKVQREEQNVQLQQTIADNEAKIAEVEATIKK